VGAVHAGCFVLRCMADSLWFVLVLNGHRWTCMPFATCCPSKLWTNCCTRAHRQPVFFCTVPWWTSCVVATPLAQSVTIWHSCPS
jgi:hypothetical protein